MIGGEAVERGAVDERAVALALIEAGWGVVPFGQSVWDPRRFPGVGNAAVLAAVTATYGAMRHPPDLLAGKAPGRIRLVEVVNCGTWERRALELAKMSGLQEWAHLAPVWIVDTSDWRAWEHLPTWADMAVSDVTRDGRGSGDPWCLYRRRGADLPFSEAFL